MERKSKRDRAGITVIKQGRIRKVTSGWVPGEGRYKETAGKPWEKGGEIPFKTP